MEGVVVFIRLIGLSSTATGHGAGGGTTRTTGETTSGVGRAVFTVVALGTDAITLVAMVEAMTVELSVAGETLLTLASDLTNDMADSSITVSSHLAFFLGGYSGIS